MYYIKFNEKIFYFENFGFLQKFPVRIGFFQSIMVVSIIYECWKVENVLGNKFLLPVILEQCGSLVEGALVSKL